VRQRNYFFIVIMKRVRVVPKQKGRPRKLLALMDAILEVRIIWIRVDNQVTRSKLNSFGTDFRFLNFVHRFNWSRRMEIEGMW